MIFKGGNQFDHVFEDGESEDELVKIRTDRHKNRAISDLIMPSVQNNIRGGRLPDPEDTGSATQRFLQSPSDA